jgi:hypothetical protein
MTENFISLLLGTNIDIDIDWSQTIYIYTIFPLRYFSLIYTHHTWKLFLPPPPSKVKIVPAENLQKKGRQHDPRWKLCHTTDERWISPLHWVLIYQTGLEHDYRLGKSLNSERCVVNFGGSPYKWWRRVRLTIDKTRRQYFDGLIVYF